MKGVTLPPPIYYPLISSNFVIRTLLEMKRIVVDSSAHFPMHNTLHSAGMRERRDIGVASAIVYTYFLVKYVIWLRYAAAYTKYRSFTSNIESIFLGFQNRKICKLEIQHSNCPSILIDWGRMDNCLNKRE